MEKKDQFLQYFLASSSCRDCFGLIFSRTLILDSILISSLGVDPSNAQSSRSFRELRDPSPFSSVSAVSVVV